MINREVMRFTIENKVIKYKDRKWDKEVQCIPRDEDFIKKIQFSRNRFPHFLATLFNFTKEEMKEYEGAKDDEALAEIIIRDAKKKGCKLISKNE